MLSDRFECLAVCIWNSMKFLYSVLMRIQVLFRNWVLISVCIYRGFFWESALFLQLICLRVVKDTLPIHYCIDWLLSDCVYLSITLIYFLLFLRCLLTPYYFNWLFLPTFSPYFSISHSLSIIYWQIQVSLSLSFTPEHTYPL